jgi:hypothetical protein
MRLERLILTFKSDEIVLHALYKTHDGPNPGTSAPQREVEKLTRNGLTKQVKGA